MSLTRTNKLTFSSTSVCLTDVSFRPNPCGGLSFKGVDPRAVTFLGDNTCDFRSVFVDHNVLEGIYRWDVQIKYAEGLLFKIDSFFSIGIVPTRLLSKCNLMLEGVSGACCLHFYRDDHYTLHSDLRGIRGESTRNPKIKDGSRVGIEVNVPARTVSFFVDDKKEVNAITGITTPLYIGMSGNRKSSFTSLSFRRLDFPTPSPVQNSFYEYEAQ